MNLPVISLMNTDCNVKHSQFPIIANDASISSITFFLSQIKSAYNKGNTGDKK